jgi:predicted dehydrogenase
MIRTDERVLGVAVVGAGYWGPNLLRSFQATEQFEVRYLCDLDTDRARTVLGRYSTVQVISDLEVALADSGVDCVVVATPPKSHLPVAMAALRAGKHVMVEKPLATSLAAAQELVDEADRRGLTLMCDHTYCYTPSVLKIREIIQSGELGELHFVDSVRINLGLVQRDVNVVWDLAPHDLSILDFVLPDHVEPVAVSVHGADPLGAGQACIAYMTLHLSTGAIAHIHVNWLSPTKVRTTMFGGSKRTLVWDDLNPSQRITMFDRGVDLNSMQDVGLEDRRQALVSYRSGDVVSPALIESEALRGVAREFAQAVLEERKPLTDGSSGLRVLKILEAASLSLQQQGATIELGATR